VGSSGSRPTPRLFLLDAHALIYRAYYAFVRRPLINSKGENTSAPFGIARFLQDTLDKHRPDYLAAVFDAGVSFRDEIYPDYKATRERMPDDLRASIGSVRDVIRSFGVRIIEVDGYEADDVIGSLVSQARAQEIEAVIVSGDKDFYQLLAPGVKLLNPGRGGRSGIATHWVEDTGVVDKFGVRANQVADYLALVGDSSDNVPGARGIGPKTAKLLLAEHDDVDAVIRHAETLRPPRLRRLVRSQAESILLSKQLVTIHTDLQVKLDLERVKLSPPNAARLHDIYTKLEFWSLAREVAVKSPAAQVGPKAARERTGPELPPVKIVTTARELQEVTGELATQARIGIHTEPTRLGASRGSLVGLALALDDGRAWYLPFGHEFPLDLPHESPTEDPESAIATPGSGSSNLSPFNAPSAAPLRELLQTSDTLERVGYDVKRHAFILSRAGGGLGSRWYDVMVAAYLLDPGSRSHGIVPLASKEFGERHPEDSEFGGTRSKMKFSELTLDRAAELTCGRARLALRLAKRFRKKLADAGLEKLMAEMEMRLSPTLLRMELAGISLDADVFGEMRSLVVSSLTDLREELFKAAGSPFNMNSTPQLRSILFDRLGLPVLRRTKTGPSTDAAVLEELAGRGHELPRLMLEYRELEKLRSTYVEAIPALVDERTGRLHTSFNQAVAQTGRLSSSNPNLQNIPIRSEFGRQVRRGFVASPHRRFLAVDYSQIELRILAHFSGDPVFVSAFHEGVDIHRQTASLLFGAPVEAVTPEMRNRAKTVNFATLYGQGAFSLAKQMGIPLKEAKGFIEDYFAKLEGVQSYLEKQVSLARESGFVETLMGRRRAVPELRSRSWNVRQAGERIAQNTPIQGSAADLIRRR